MTDNWYSKGSEKGLVYIGANNETERKKKKMGGHGGIMKEHSGFRL